MENSKKRGKVDLLAQAPFLLIHGGRFKDPGKVVAVCSSFFITALKI
jgi:hypothetical protein